MTKIKVLLSAYNGERYIFDQVESIISQNGDFDIKICIRDDGSSDSTCEIIEKLQGKHLGRIELIKGNNIGYNASFFELLRLANGADYYAFSDQDDVWLKDKLNNAIQRLQAEDNSIPLLYSCTSYMVYDDLKPFAETRKQKKEITLYNSLIQNICPGHNQVFNSKLLDLLKMEIDTEQLYVYDSWVCNVAVLFGKLLFDNNSNTFYRQHKTQQLGYGKGKIGSLFSSKKRFDADTTMANKAIGIEQGPSHTEIIVTKEGPKIVEIGARLGGDCITTHLVPLSTGVDMVEACILLSIGKTPNINKRFEKGSAIKYLAQKKGIVEKVEGFSEARHCRGVCEVVLNVGPGDTINDIVDSASRCGFVISQDNDAEQAFEDCCVTLAKIHISTRKQ